MTYYEAPRKLNKLNQLISKSEEEPHILYGSVING